MNRYLVDYMMQDSWQGLKRNPLCTLASVFLMALALLLIGILLSVRLVAAEAIDYVESQLTLKVYVNETLNAKEVAAILAEKEYVEKTAVETGNETLERLAFFFNGKEHLMDAFRNGAMQDAVKLQVADKTELAAIAEELEAINGIDQVVYPQQMAILLDSWITNLERYGTASAIALFGIAFLMVFLTFHLALYKRQQELAVKLFVGMNPKAVRAQFLMEAALLSLFGAGLAVLLTAIFQVAVLMPLFDKLPFLGQLEGVDIAAVMGLQLLSALVIGLSASYLSTRKGIADG
ncbi:FtsX-like permease family protein [Planococcus glaciei]|uniref:Cell division protein FtsX n=1 Tax=Planococcus glaciei TaxID=459472 RepID=A0A7H8QEH7_9BACL|nr:permease-like cell division protein FtsX [Planococcus glaciei]QKX52289.1 FtsX-like permease family protein [Planococcus glaciei]